MKKDNLPSNVYKHHNKYYVQQQVNHQLIRYGSFKERADAIQLRNKLIQDGTLKERWGKHRIKDWNKRYIYETQDGKYSIQKQVNGEYCSFGVWNTLEDAIDERNYLESIGWDYDNME